MYVPFLFRLTSGWARRSHEVLESGRHCGRSRRPLFDLTRFLQPFAPSPRVHQARRARRLLDQHLPFHPRLHPRRHPRGSSLGLLSGTAVAAVEGPTVDSFLYACSRRQVELTCLLFDCFERSVVDHFQVGATRSSLVRATAPQRRASDATDYSVSSCSLLYTPSTRSR